jgi:hypothetical protein
MRNFSIKSIQAKSSFRLAILFTVLCSLWALPPLSSAKSQANSVTITNNSGWEIHHVYFSPVDNDNWSADQLNGTISSGGSSTINISSDQSQIKIITEDADGCFLYNTVSSSGNSTWTITSAATPDCGN